MTGIVCDCTGAPPWPRMVRLSAAGPNRYYLCRTCGGILEHVCRPDGTIQETRRHQEPGDGLPKAVREQTRDVTGLVEYEQLSFFE